MRATCSRHNNSRRDVDSYALESQRRAAQACADRGVTLGAGYNWRHQPALKAIRRMIDDGTLEKICHDNQED